MKDARLNVDDDNETIITIHLRSRITDQYNEGSYKTLKRVGGPARPVEM